MVAVETQMNITYMVRWLQECELRRMMMSAVSDGGTKNYMGLLRAMRAVGLGAEVGSAIVRM